MRNIKSKSMLLLLTLHFFSFWILVAQFVLVVARSHQEINVKILYAQDIEWGWYSSSRKRPFTSSVIQFKKLLQQPAVNPGRQVRWVVFMVFFLCPYKHNYCLLLTALLVSLTRNFNQSTHVLIIVSLRHGFHSSIVVWCR